jgi:hypothetical protein
MMNSVLDTSQNNETVNEEQAIIKTMPSVQGQSETEIIGFRPTRSGPEELSEALSLGGMLVLDRHESNSDLWIVKHVSRREVRDNLSVTSFRYSDDFTCVKVRIIWPPAYMKNNSTILKSSSGGELDVMMAVPASLKRLIEHMICDKNIHRRFVWTDVIGVTFLRDVCGVDSRKLWDDMAAMYLRYVTVPSLNYYDEPDYFGRLWMFQEYTYGRIQLRAREGSDAAQKIACLRGSQLVPGLQTQVLSFNGALLDPTSLPARIAEHISLCIATKGYKDIRDLEVACFGVLAKALGRNLPNFEWVIQGNYAGPDELRNRLLSDIASWINIGIHSELPKNLSIPRQAQPITSMNAGPQSMVRDAMMGQAMAGLQSTYSYAGASPPTGTNVSPTPTVTHASVEALQTSYGCCPLEVNEAAETEFAQLMAEWKAEHSRSWKRDLQFLVEWASAEVPAASLELRHCAQRLYGTIVILKDVCSGSGSVRDYVDWLVGSILSYTGRQLSFEAKKRFFSLIRAQARNLAVISMEEYIKARPPGEIAAFISHAQLGAIQSVRQLLANNADVNAATEVRFAPNFAARTKKHVLV